MMGRPSFELGVISATGLKFTFLEFGYIVAISTIIPSLTRVLLDLYIFHPLTRLLGHAVARSKRHSKERQNHGETMSVIFRSGQRSGNERSSNVKFGLSQYFSTNWRITQELEGRATLLRKSALDNAFNALSPGCPQIWPKINGLASREQKL